MLIRLLCILVFLGLAKPALQAEYLIQGHINYTEEWDSIVYLAIVSTIDKLYSASPQNIINTAPIDEHGNFLMSGDDLPEEYGVYRLYLSKYGTDSYLFIGGKEENFIHLILNNQSEVRIKTSPGEKIFDQYTIEGEPATMPIKKFYEEWQDAMRLRQHHLISNAKTELVRRKFNERILSFADTCQSALVRLIALEHLDQRNIDDSLKQYVEEYRLAIARTIPNSNFVKTILIGAERANMPDREMALKQKEKTIRTLWVIIGCLLLMLFFLLFKWFGKHSAERFSPPSLKDHLGELSVKETEVLKYLIKGKSNKEIASLMHIEPTTAKTHVHNIFKKLGLKNRKEARKYAVLLS